MPMAKDSDFANQICPLIHKSEVTGQDGVRTLKCFRVRDTPSVIINKAWW